MKSKHKSGSAALFSFAPFLLLFLLFDAPFSGSDALRPPKSEAASLKEAALAKGKLVGVATQTKYLQDAKYASVLNEEFDAIAPEYEMKMSETQPRRGEFDFSQSDRLVDYASQNGKLIRGHALVWHGALPDWVSQGNFSRAEWIQILKAHITEEASRYKGKIYAWDVVNEAFLSNGDYRPTVWYNNIGPEYIELAFQFAREADPFAKLFYNDFGAEAFNAKSGAIYNLLKAMKAKGLPIDGIGFQTHISVKGIDYAGMKSNMRRFAELGLDTDITEMDVDTRSFSGSRNEMLRAQADAYANVSEIALSLPSCKEMFFWGLRDGDSWLNEDAGVPEFPLLFGDDYSRKPAYQALLRAFSFFGEAAYK